MGGIRQLSFKQWVLLVVMALLPFLFQNCGSGGSIMFEDIKVQEVSSMEAFFDYPYKSAPEYFIELHVLRDPAGIGLSQLKIFAAVASADGVDEAVAYVVRVNSGVTEVCAASMGTLAAGQTMIEFLCAPKPVPSEVTVELQFTPADGVQRSISKTFN